MRPDPPSVLLFDLMDTLLRDPYLDALRAGTGTEPGAVRRFRDPGAWPLFERGAIDEAEFVRRFFADPDGARRGGLAFDAAAFHRARRSGYRWLPGMRELVDDLRGRPDDGGPTCWVASNYPVWIEELRERFALDTWFDGVVASHHLGVRKPDRRFYEALLDRVDAGPEACLFVDDREANCAAARDVGMRAHRFVDAGALRARLRDEGVPLPDPARAPAVDPG